MATANAAVSDLLVGKPLPHLIPHLSRNRVDVVVALNIREVGEHLTSGEELLAVYIYGVYELSLVLHS
jgi:hypothetical protein